MQSPIVIVLILHQSGGLILDGGLQSTGISSHIVLNLCLTLPILIAVIRKLPRKGIGVLHIRDSVLLHGILQRIGVLEGSDSALLDGILDLVGAVEDGSVHGVEPIAQTILKAVQLVDHGLVVEAALDVTNGSHSSLATARIATATITTANAIATEATEQGHQDDDNPPTFAEAITANAIHHAITSVVAATIIVTNDGSNIRCAETIRTEHRFTSSLVNIKRFLRICLIYALQSRLRALPITSKHRLRLGYRWVKNCIACLQASSGEIP